ncbi:M1 family metallopeptidase [Acinetobacter baumannii]|uniref:M1 family metallopeptidase n=1 Tax=Acinetobacter baumannii TaxID=470 RepID=UPI001CBAD173|nr:M1 family metallopeptidase [Acinetobacter baumannii]MCA4364395.1 M1 family metallopeptidase [Acinetobacter baumannii]MCF4187748.1 M1 family metallopeptidase [Acinetobacter baumannii]MCJ0729310.1 M1 family metallopeptidase [Acinetobacter baumannii]MCJ0769465.1 M1 family metallopeptidase [Acinetobacter baumannii]MCJ0787266.1 M1 family metallopeptidase [Acinetobacter baumannii]
MKPLMLVKPSFKKRLLLTTLLSLSATQIFASNNSEQIPIGKLPEWVVPESYDLDFKIDPAQKGYTGKTTIHLKLAQATDHIWIHGKSLTVKDVNITSAEGVKTKAKYEQASEIDGVSKIKFAKTLPAGQYQLVLDFNAAYDQQLDGIYKIEFEGKPYVMTQMEAISARQSFPSFDEPRFKTPFNIRLTIPSKYSGFANTQQTSEQIEKSGWKTLSFAQTKPLPTYLLALAVGPWQLQKGPDIGATSWRKQPIQLRGIAPDTKAEKMQQALSETPAILKTLEDYFAFGYPFDKLDLLAAPDFAAGAMENPGLITFRDYLMLLDKDSPVFFVQNSFNVNAHELAHQWFGDVVTMPWWDDLWLNESFATWMQSKITQKLHPEFNADLERITDTADAMKSDSLVSVRRIRQPILSNADIQTAFDGITYQKGAAVLNMFESYLGEEKFKQGVRNYINKHQYGNATANDLISALAEQSGQGERFTRAMKSFLDQPGVPLINTALQQEGNKVFLNVKQSRYLPVGSKGDARSLWGVPLCVRYEVPNADAAGYYQFSLPQKEFTRLTAATEKLSNTEQLAYAYAISAAFNHGDINLLAVVDAAKKFANSNSRQISTALFSQLSTIHRHVLKTEAERERFRKVLANLYLPKLNQLGYVSKTDESAEDSLWRSELVRFLALDIQVPEVRTQLLKQSDALFAQKQLNFAQVTPELLPTILAVRVQEKGQPAFDRLSGELQRVTQPTQRLAILTALGSANQEATRQQARQLILNPRVKVGEVRTVVNSINSYGDEQGGLWSWFKVNHDAVFDRLGKSSAGRFPAMFSGAACTQQQAAQLNDFFAPRTKELVGVERGLKQTKERIQLCESLVAKQDGSIVQQLKL